MLLTIRDESATGNVTNELTLDILTETITVRDRTLSIILSKAFLLAADDKISDPTIVRQISR